MGKDSTGARMEGAEGVEGMTFLGDVDGEPFWKKEDEVELYRRPHEVTTGAVWSAQGDLIIRHTWREKDSEWSAQEETVEIPREDVAAFFEALCKEKEKGKF
jgi:hypothetical protein